LRSPPSPAGARQLARYGEDAKLREYLTSRRGRSYLRMTIRNRTLVDTLIDRALGTDASAAEPPATDPDAASTEATETPEQSEESA
jgi:hypothetical protein